MAVITKRLGDVSFHNRSLVLRYRLIELKIEERDGSFRSTLFQTAAETAQPFESEQGAIMRKLYIGQTIIDSDKLRRDKSWKRFSDNVRRTVNSGAISIASSSQFMPQATLEST